MNSSEALKPQFDRLQQGALVVGGIALALAFAGGMARPAQFFRSYLLAYVFWIGFPLGSMALLMLHHLAGGYWGFVIRRPLEAGTRSFRAMALLFVPVLAGVRYGLFAWARPDSASDPMWRQKHFYLNAPFFVARAVVYFAAWIVLAHYLNKWSAEQDRTGEARLLSRFQALSGAGLVIYGLTITYASVDWVMSLERGFFSTIYGMIFMVIPALTALAFVVVVTMLLAGAKPLSDVIAESHFQDLGNILLTFVMLWAYLSFSQFLIVWSGNLQREVPWYLSRAKGGWAGVALFLILFHFAVPFVLLLNRPVKRRMRVLAALASALIFVSLVDVFWLVTPAFYPSLSLVSGTDVLMDALAVTGIGGIWMARFISQLKSMPPLPLRDARFVEAPFGATEKEASGA
jgi:hypothetical protein